MRTTEISNSDDTIDSRDVIERIETLQGEREDFEHDGDGNRTESDWAEAHPEEAVELAALEALAAEAEGYADDWSYGAALIRDSYFTDYCEELVKDIADLPKDIPGYIVIDWEATAENIKVGYTSVEFDGVTYWVR